MAIWAGTGGHTRLTAPHQHWKLANGDTIEVLVFEYYYEAHAYWSTPKVSGTRYLHLRFRSSLRDPDRDWSDVRAAADVMCPIADSAGFHQLLIQPTRASLLSFLSVSRDYRFTVHSAHDCEEQTGKKVE